MQVLFFFFPFDRLENVTTKLSNLLMITQNFELCLCAPEALALAPMLCNVECWAFFTWDKRDRGSKVSHGYHYSMWGWLLFLSCIPHLHHMDTGFMRLNVAYFLCLCLSSLGLRQWMNEWMKCVCVPCKPIEQVYIAISSTLHVV